ncbi:MAG TPA: methyltransferase domain-containing protein [Blastocatellia bacterium]|nr:methyltransferase domain-containing protein [Blastocatellia bacterium]
MRHEEYRAMFELEDHLWWYRGMRAVTASILDPHLPSRPDLCVLDVGCGTGYSLKWLGERLGTRATFGVDISPHASAFWNEHGLDTAAIASAHQIPLASEVFDLVTCFDVIYQFSNADAETAIAEMHRVLKPGGLLFIREPAYDWMRAGHDLAVGTDHRYTLTKLRRLLTAQGFALRRATYANSLLFGAAVPHRLVSKWRGSEESDVKPVAEWLNKALAAALKIEALLIGRLSFPFGLSVTALAQKKAR